MGAYGVGGNPRLCSLAYVACYFPSNKLDVAVNIAFLVTHLYGFMLSLNCFERLKKCFSFLLLPNDLSMFKSKKIILILKI